jgi:hypothetical protein
VKSYVHDASESHIASAIQHLGNVCLAGLEQAGQIGLGNVLLFHKLADQFRDLENDSLLLEKSFFFGRTRESFDQGHTLFPFLHDFNIRVLSSFIMPTAVFSSE